MTNETNRAAGENFDSMSWQQLAETLAFYLSPALASHQYSMTDETMHDALGACHQVTKRKQAATNHVEDIPVMVERHLCPYCQGAGVIYTGGIYMEGPCVDCADCNATGYVQPGKQP